MRKVLLPTIIFVATILLVLRLFYLQVIDDSLKLKSDNNAIKIAYDYPERGYIYDRNGKLLVANQPSYDIMVIPKDIKNIDTIEFCSLLKITKEEYFELLNQVKSVSILSSFVISSSVGRRPSCCSRRTWARSSCTSACLSWAPGRAPRSSCRA